MRGFALAAAFAAPLVAAASTGGQSPSGPGERAFQKCYSCHDLAAGRNDLTGPTLHAIAGRPIAAEPAFDYSPALRRFAVAHPVWTDELLDRFISDPEALVPGTAMTFTGIHDPKERADLIAWLRDVSGERH